MAIETNQGISGSGNVFGYDHARCNFIEWVMEGGDVVVASVENDVLANRCGSLKETMKDARKIAREQNQMPNSSLRSAIRLSVAAFA